MFLKKFVNCDEIKRNYYMYINCSRDKICKQFTMFENVYIELV